MVFNPEIVARAIMPKEILSEGGGSHLALFLANGCVDIAVIRDGKTLWTEAFQIEHATSSLEEEVSFIEKRNWHERIFRKVTVASPTPIFTLVPDAFFDPEKANTLLEFHSGKQMAGTAFKRIAELALYMVYDKPPTISPLEKLWPNIDHFPLAALWLKFSYSKLQFGHDSLMALVEHNILYVSVYKRDQLQLFNSYHTTSPEDVLYYLSSICMSLNLHMETCHLGMVADTKTFAIAEPYFTHLHDLAPEQQAPESLFHLFVQHLCA